MVDAAGDVALALAAAIDAKHKGWEDLLGNESVHASTSITGKRKLEGKRKQLKATYCWR